MPFRVFFLPKYLVVSEKSSNFAVAFEKRGALAHLVERMHGMHEVVSSSLICSTKNGFHVREGLFLCVEEGKELVGLVDDGGDTGQDEAFAGNETP